MQYPFSVRRATPADKESVLALARAIDPEDWIPEEYDSFMTEQPPGGLFVAEMDGRAVACYHVGLVAPGEAYLKAMRVDPQMQGRGLGSLLARAQVEQIRAIGPHNIHLISRTDNVPAHRAVMRAGFQAEGEWIVSPDLPVADLSLSAPQKARPARPEDQAEFGQCLQELGPRPLRHLLCTPDSPHTVRNVQPEDWAPAHTVVVDGPLGVIGLMTLSFADGRALIRRLEGSPEVVADLLAYAVAEARRKECKELAVGLPAYCEPLLAPLGVAPEAWLRNYVFTLSMFTDMPKIEQVS
jgi:GNAT superfamily N-acetyltransferase